MIQETRKLHQKLYFLVVVAIAIGATLGYCFPEWGVRMKPFGDGFIKREIPPDKERFAVLGLNVFIKL